MLAPSLGHPAVFSSPSVHNFVAFRSGQFQTVEALVMGKARDWNKAAARPYRKIVGSLKVRR
jgi:hypothetical protein